MSQSAIKDPTNPQFYVVLSLTLLVGFLLGAVVVAVWGPYALERRRIEQAAVEQAQRQVRSQAEVERAMQIVDDAVKQRGPLKRERSGK